ncbi:MAG: hypothetical protein LC799_22720 [Actinobacteria bacterium]|nr:hypothetical protein [Actinomycetota bacterium]
MARENTTRPRAVMQRENELARLTTDGKRTDDGTKCTLLAIRETGKTWAIYPHGAGQLGVRLPDAEALRLAHAILAGAE